MAGDNKTLGKFHLMNIPSAPRGIPQIEVTFDIDANGIVNVSAKDTGTGQEQKITISGSTALSDDEVDRMVTDADAHADEDRKRKEEVEVRNQADTLVYATEKTLKELGDKVPEDDKTAVEEALTASQNALAGDDVERSSRPPRSSRRPATSSPRWSTRPRRSTTPPLRPRPKAKRAVLRPKKW